MKKILLLLILIASITASYAQSHTISGYVEDSETGEKLISAYIFDEISNKGTVTNAFGFYSLTLPQDSVKLKVSYIGYVSSEQKLYLNKNEQINFKLTPSNVLEDIEITGERVERIEEQTQMSRIEVPLEQIKTMPAIFGEVDVLKTMQLLPGVQAGTEGTSGLFVRGGSPDQNLVLLDNVPVYNVSHFLGIFSVFNADALKNVSITKGGFPARYGGRLSSILDISMKDGNMKGFHGAGAIGNLTSKIMIEGPIVKDKASFIVSGRRSYADLFMRPLIKAGSDGKEGIDLHFYDINAKANYIINPKNRIYFSLYSGRDLFGFKSKHQYDNSRYENRGGVKWGNLISALRWNNQLNPKLFLNTTLTFSDFSTVFFAESKSKDESGTINFLAKYVSGIRDYAARMDFDYIPVPNHYVKFGASYINHTYRPGAVTFKFEENGAKQDTVIGTKNSYSNELDAYVEDDFTIGNLKSNIGLHASAFITGKNTYYSLQPRIGLRYLLGDDYAIKASYATMKQYINLITSESISTPLDLWVPSTEKVKPQFSQQVALGVAKTLQNDFEISLEGYYKEMENVISFKPGSSFFNEGFGETDWESKVVQGKGQAYGMEFLVQKKKGRFSGWLAYTLSWNWRQFDAINNGKKFPYKYDRRHDFAIVGKYNITDNILISGSWIYSTGNAVTIPIFKYPFSNYSEIKSLGEKNSFRLSDSHRLDLSIEFHKKKKRWERAWVIGLYNAYFHKNPFFIISDREKGKTVFKEISLLPILPSVSYKFKF